MKQELDSLRTDLIGMLHHEVSCATALLKSLENEKGALSSMDDVLISVNSTKKQSLLNELQDATKARTMLMAKYGYESNFEGSNNFFESENSTPDLNALFNNLTEVAQYCFNENRLIGQLINRRTQFISQALGSLSPSIEQTGFTYSQSGNTQNHNCLRNLGTI